MSQEEIVPGGLYTYECGIPAGVKGERYLVHRHVLDVPTYQRKVLVEALSGRDKGLWFTCSPSNFVHRYKPYVEEPQ